MKKNIKLVIAFILGIVVTGIIAYAESVISGNLVGYSNSSSKLSATTVQAAIDEVYDKTFVKKQIVAYEYQETGTNKCIMGEEKTCKETKCYETKTAGSCPIGTVVKYYVNNHESHYFYVLHDDGNTMTMQQRENTIRNIPWHANENNSQNGPDTILSILEAATNTWVNVNVLEYTPGETLINGSNYAICGYDTTTYQISSSNCTNPYISSTLGNRKARARMITAPEASQTGCLVGTSNIDHTGSCPDFMHNYLYQSTNFGGSYDDNKSNENGKPNYDYWMMSSSSSNATMAWRIAREGVMATLYTGLDHDGARAVIVISK